MTDDVKASDLVQPADLAVYLTGVYRDEEASNFERTMAAAGLTSFWMGTELNRMCEMFERLAFIPAGSMPKEKLL